MSCVPAPARICRTCHVEKPLDDFVKRSKGREGRGWRCKPCQNQYREQFRTPDTSRRDMLRHRYGMEVADYEAYFAMQDGRCAICRRMSAKRLSVDHCHRTGLVRGLLCDPCNQALGWFDDDTARIKAALVYLEFASTLFTSCEVTDAL